MARLIPSPELIGPIPPSKRNEFKTAMLLAEDLGEQYLVFHEIHWATQNCDKTFLGEIDFIVMSPLGRLLLIEQKNGGLRETSNGLMKTYGDRQKSVECQMSRNLDNLLEAFEVRTGKKLDIDLMLYCPDYRIQNKVAAALPAGRIVDQSSAEFLPTIIHGIFSERSVANGVCTDAAIIEAFLCNQLKIRYDVGYLGKLAKSEYVQQASGLSDWVRRMSGSPLRLLIQATAGSGKTQLALDELNRAQAMGLSALYVCFNRHLAIDMKLATGQPESCTTLHELARILYEEKGFRFEPTSEGFQKSIDHFIAAADSLSGSFDVLLIDEAQDFDAEWIEALLKLSKPAGRVIVLQDLNQQLYARTQYDFAGWIRLDHDISYRCPRIVNDHINEFELTPSPVFSQSVIEGLDTVHEIYDPTSPDSLEQATSKVIKQLMKEGHELQDIVVLTMKGAESSQILKMDLLNKQALRKISGRSPEGDYTYTEGELFADTVFRFKGRSANCVVLTEIDFEELDDNKRRRLFVGLTRARLRVGLVMSGRAIEFLLMG